MDTVRSFCENVRTAKSGEKVIRNLVLRIVDEHIYSPHKRHSKSSLLILIFTAPS